MCAEMSAQWDLGQLLGFLGRWSAARRHEQMQGVHPLTYIQQRLP